MPFSLPLVEPVTGEVPGPTLDGVMDLIEENDVIAEFKTSAKTLDSRFVRDSVQLTCYAYAHWMLFQREPKSLKVLNFVKAKNPKIVPLETKREIRDFRRLFHQAFEVLKGIRSGVFYRKSNFMCKDCEYEEPCQSLSGNPN